MIYLYIIILSMIAVISLYVFKDVLSPAFIFCLPWIMSFMGLAISNYDYSDDSFAYFYLVIGVFVFIIGFGLAMSNTKLKKRYVETKEVYHFKPSVFKMLIFFEIIITLYMYFTYYSYIKNNFVISIYQTIRHGLTNNMLELPGFLIYARSIIIIISVCMVIIYFYIQEKHRSKFQKVVIIQLVLAVLNLMLTMTRNGILLSTLPMLIAFLICKNFNNRKVLKYAIRFLIIFLVFFSVIAVWKTSYLNSHNSYFDLLANQFSLYMSGSLVGIEKFISSSNDYLYGQNTFRFFYALFNSLFGTGVVQNLVQDSVTIGNNQGTNVFTFYHYYIKDFGLVYALIVQFFIGIFHGLLYRMMLSKRPLSIFLFSIMIYPLVMQFFQDQYISLLSTWIQHLLVGLLFFKSTVFIRRVKNEQQIS